MENNKTHIMVIDDDPAVTVLIQRTLEGEGFIVTITNDGQLALTMLAEHQPDLILLDVMMPGLDGYEVLRNIREKSQIPVIMLTGITEPASVAMSLDLGADDYIRKPFWPRLLIARIQAKLRRVNNSLIGNSNLGPTKPYGGSD